MRRSRLEIRFDPTRNHWRSDPSSENARTTKQCKSFGKYNLDKSNGRNKFRGGCGISDKGGSLKSQQSKYFLIQVHSNGVYRVSLRLDHWANLVDGARFYEIQLYHLWDWIYIIQSEKKGIKIMFWNKMEKICKQRELSVEKLRLLLQ